VAAAGDAPAGDDAIYRDSTADALRPAAAVLVVLYLVLGVPQTLLTLSGTDRVVLVSTQVAGAVVAAAVWVAAGRVTEGSLRRRGLRLMSALASTVVGSALVALAVHDAMWQVTDLLLIVVAAGALVHTRALAVAIVAACVVGWLAVSLTVAPAGLDLNTALGMLTAVGVAVVLHLSRTRSVARLEAARESIRALAVTDELTGLANRRGLMLAGTPLLEHAERAGRAVTLLYIDVDGLKQVNDGQGHAAGDRLLVTVGDALREVFRSADVVARTGGDEFAVLLVGCGRREAGMLQQRLAARLKSLHASASVGAAYRDVDGQGDPGGPVSLEELVDQADLAMYAVKARRRAGDAPDRFVVR